MRGAKINYQGDFREPIVNLLKDLLERRAIDAVLLPMRVPSGESFAWVLARDADIIDQAVPLPPIITVQGAKALSTLAKSSDAEMKIAALMRPCEIRAAIELNKLQQLNLDNVFLFSIDCPGSLPIADYLKDAVKGDENFNSLLRNWDCEGTRDICKICDKFSKPASDIHIGLLSGNGEGLFVVPGSPKGEELLAALEIDVDQDLGSWDSKVEEVGADRKRKREEKWVEIRREYGGAEKLSGLFSQCITCHTCRSVCPICYCRQCYFESAAFKLPAYNYMERARDIGSLRLPPDNLLFHLGRMQHVAVSCVSCGLCEDMCPMSIPISHLFSYVAEKAQSIFGYVAGLDPEEALPLVTYRAEELENVPRSYTETYKERERQNV